MNTGSIFRNIKILYDTRLFYAVFSLPCNKCTIPPSINNHFYSECISQTCSCIFVWQCVCVLEGTGKRAEMFFGETSGTFGIIVSSIWNSQWGKVFPFFGYLRAVHIVSFYQRRVGILHLWGKNLFEINILFQYYWII